MKFIRYFVRYTTVSNRFNFLPVHLSKQYFQNSIFCFQIRVFNFRTRNLVEMKARHGQPSLDLYSVPQKKYEVSAD